MFYRIRKCGAIRKFQFRSDHVDGWKTISLGRCREADALALLRAIESGHCTPESYSFLSVKAKTALAQEGFIPEVQSTLLDEFVERFYERYAVNKAENTVRNMRQVVTQLRDFFRNRDIRSINVEDAEAWHAWRARTTAPATLNRDIKRVRQVFAAAVRYEIISRSPFRFMKAGPTSNPERFEFVDLDRVAKVMDACRQESEPQQWRTVIALSRFAGLRIHTELVALEWNKHIDFAKGRIVVPKCKTSRRTMPMFPELRKELWAERDKTGFVIKHCRVKSNLDRGLKRLIDRAGVDRWCRIWHNQRATRQNELIRLGFPRPAVCKWLGNSIEVAEQHYEHELEDDFNKALKTTTK